MNEVRLGKQRIDLMNVVEPRDRQWYWLVVGLVLPLIASTVDLYGHAKSLWEQPAFRFFPLAICLGAFLLLRTCELRPASTSRSWIGAFVNWTGIAIVVWGLWILSPARIHLGIVVVVLGWALRAFGGTRWTRIVAICSLLAITVPWPRNLDIRLIYSLQRTAAWACNSILESIGIPNVVENSVLRIRGMQIFVLDVCRDAGSCFALVAFALALVVVRRKPLWVSVFVILGAICISVLGDVMRLLSIVFAKNYFNVDLTTDVHQIILGSIVFGISASFILLMQVSISALFAPLQSHLKLNHVEALYETLVTWPTIEFQESSETNSKRSWFTQAISGALCIPLLMTGSMSAYVYLHQQQSPPTKVTMRSEQAALLPGENALPEQFGKLKRSKYSVENRSERSLLGEYSHVWNYDDGETQLTVSLDFPFSSTRSLPVLYELQGWTVTEKHRAAFGELNISLDQMRVVNRFGIHGLAYHACFTQQGAPVLESEKPTGPPPNLLTKFKSMAATASPSSNRSFYQVQLLVETGKELSEERSAEYEKMFTELFELIRQKSLPNIAIPK